MFTMYEYLQIVGYEAKNRIIKTLSVCITLLIKKSSTQTLS